MTNVLMLSDLELHTHYVKGEEEGVVNSVYGPLIWVPQTHSSCMFIKLDNGQMEVILCCIYCSTSPPWLFGLVRHVMNDSENNPGSVLHARLTFITLHWTCELDLDYFHVWVPLCFTWTASKALQTAERRQIWPCVQKRWHKAFIIQTG